MWTVKQEVHAQDMKHVEELAKMEGLCWIWKRAEVMLEKRIGSFTGRCALVEFSSMMDIHTVVQPPSNLYYGLSSSCYTETCKTIKQELSVLFSQSLNPPLNLLFL